MRFVIFFISMVLSRIRRSEVGQYSLTELNSPSACVIVVNTLVCIAELENTRVHLDS